MSTIPVSTDIRHNIYQNTVINCLSIVPVYMIPYWKSRYHFLAETFCHIYGLR